MMLGWPLDDRVSEQEGGSRVADPILAEWCRLPLVDYSTNDGAHCYHRWLYLNQPPDEAHAHMAFP